MSFNVNVCHFIIPTGCKIDYVVEIEKKEVTDGRLTIVGRCRKISNQTFDEILINKKTTFNFDKIIINDEDVNKMKKNEIIKLFASIIEKRSKDTFKAEIKIDSNHFKNGSEEERLGTLTITTE
jgi:hypothetical protein